MENKIDFKTLPEDVQKNVQKSIKKMTWNISKTASSGCLIITCKAILYLAIAYAIVKWANLGFPGIH